MVLLADGHEAEIRAASLSSFHVSACAKNQRFTGGRSWERLGLHLGFLMKADSFFSSACSLPRRGVK